jgi:hypothetical protein
MQRQDYDLELTRYDGRGASHVLRDGDEALADQRHRHRVGADTLACGSGGGVGSVREGAQVGQVGEVVGNLAFPPSSK